MAVNWYTEARKVARQIGVDPVLFVNLVRAESGGNPTARSPVGAYGLTQLMPGTARGLGVDPNDPYQNLRGGATYLKQQLDRFGKPELALAAYNAGPGAVEKYGGIPPYEETQAYVKRIMEWYRQTAKRDPRQAPQAARTAQVAVQAVQSGNAAVLMQSLGQIASGGSATEALGNTLAGLAQQEPGEVENALQPSPQDVNPQVDPSSPSGDVPRGKVGKPSGQQWSKLNGIGKMTPAFMLMAMRKAQALGLRVGENPYTDPVDGNHVNGSFHYQTLGKVKGKTLGRAIDISGDPKAMDAFFRWAIRFRPTELFYDPLGKYDNGSWSPDPIGNHMDHVHLSV